MKYMGSKRAMLGNGLGELLSREVVNFERFVDLFAGSGSVAKFIATKYDVPVVAFDIQEFSSVVTGAVIERDSIIDAVRLWDNWHRRANVLFERITLPKQRPLTADAVQTYRRWCGRQENLPITSAYGGHYFSPTQSVWLDCLRSSLPRVAHSKQVALAALVHAASQCAAAPGHTAQPFQPTSTAIRYVAESWNRDLPMYVRTSLDEICSQHAKVVGRSDVRSANDATKGLTNRDLVFVDPPYSGVHYSRFYHVLETVVQGGCGIVTGSGRYPIAALRPRSDYSLKGKSRAAIDDLLRNIAKAGATAIVTFPDHECSNGLSGSAIRELSSNYFRATEIAVKSKFSTLGGTSPPSGSPGRAARRDARELILLLRP